MKLSILFGLIAAGCAIGAGITYRMSVTHVVGKDQPEKLEKIDRIPDYFVERHHPEFEFALPDLPQWRSDPVLVDTMSPHPGTRQFCETENFDPGDKPAVWHAESTCGERMENLPDEFFAEPPYLHLSGQSYVFLAAMTGIERYNDPKWLAQHKAYLHVTELDDLARFGMELTAVEQLAASLSKRELRALGNNTRLLMADDYILVRLDPEDLEDNARYGVYPADVWQSFINGTPLSTSPYLIGQPCLRAVGSVCFDANPHGVVRLMNLAAEFAAFSLMAICALLLSIAWRRIQLRRKEAEARTFVLLTLSHEIRTPTASLALSLEPIRNRFDELPDDSQTAFLRICDSVQRLQRVIEGSRQYLSGELGDREIQFRGRWMPSVNDFVAGIVGQYGDRVALDAMHESKPVNLDPYWVSVCLRNLVDNAIRHGAEPIEVKVTADGPTLELTVQDGGAEPKFGLRQMSKPFFKNARSKGLGFGLSVVHRLARAMGGELRYSPSPTRFTIVLPGVLG